MKYDNYIEKIKKDGFHAGNSQITLANIIFKLNISLYKLSDEKENEYKHFTNIWYEINDKNYELILIFFLIIIFILYYHTLIKIIKLMIKMI